MQRISEHMFRRVCLTQGGGSQYHHFLFPITRLKYYPALWFLREQDNECFKHIDS